MSDVSSAPQDKTVQVVDTLPALSKDGKTPLAKRVTSRGVV